MSPRHYPRPKMEPNRDEAGETSLCQNCNGSGEGMHDGATCYACRGTGVDMQPVSEEFEFEENL